MSKKNKHNKKHGEEEGGEAWLLPYSDLMTLLLAVFIVLFAVSQVDEGKAQEIAHEFQESMMSHKEGILEDNGESIISILPEELQGTTHEESNGSEGDSTNENSGTSQEGTSDTEGDTNISQEDLEKFLGKYELSNLEELKSDLEVIFENEEMTEDMTISIDTRGLVISLNNAVLFESGSADIKVENEDTLRRIAETINQLDNYIRIEGHTDNRPISTAVYPSNWELSTARAARVVRLFINECNVSPEKVVAVGYGEYKPIADNSTEAGREKNRRIDIIVLSEKYNNLED